MDVGPIEMKRAAIYHRVSTVDQDPGAARLELERAAAQRGYSVVLSIEETGSGANNDRPGLLELLAAARRGDLDAVLVWKLDRFGRSALDVLTQIRELETAGVRFVAITQGLDVQPGGDAMSRLLLSVLGAVAEFERDLIRERTRLGLERARARGERLGRPRARGPSPDLAVHYKGAVGMSIREAAHVLRCSTWALRSSLAIANGNRERAKNGVRSSSSTTPGNPPSSRS